MTARQPWTTLEIAKLKAMGRHMDAQAIADELGRTRRAVDSMMDRLGIRMSQLRAWTTEEDRAIRELGQKLSVADLAKHLRRSPSVLRRRASEIGASFRKAGEYHRWAKHPASLREKYRSLVAGGMPHQTAAKAIGVHPSTARRWRAPAFDGVMG